MSKVAKAPAPPVAQTTASPAPGATNTTSEGTVSAQSEGGLAGAFAQRKGPLPMADFLAKRRRPRTADELKSENPTKGREGMSKPIIPEGSRFASLRDRLFGTEESTEATADPELAEKEQRLGTSEQETPTTDQDQKTAETATVPETTDQVEEEQPEGEEAKRSDAEASSQDESTAQGVEGGSEAAPAADTSSEASPETEEKEDEALPGEQQSMKENTAASDEDGAEEGASGLGNNGSASAINNPKAAGQKAEAAMDPEAMAAVVGDDSTAGVKESQEIAAPELDTSSSGAVLESLTSQPMTTMVQGMATNVGEGISEAKGNEHQEAQASLPEIEQPTGLKDGEEPLPPKLKAPSGKKPDIRKPAGDTGQKVETETKGVSTEKANFAGFFKLASKEDLNSGIRQLPDKDPSVSTSAGKRPEVELSGAADTNQNEENQQASDESILASQTESDEQTYTDFGENDVYPSVPTEMLSPSQEIAEPEGWADPGMEIMPAMDPVVPESLDPQLETLHAEAIDAEMAKQETEEANYHTEADKSREEGMLEIEAENEKAAEDQRTARAEGQAGVAAHREEWRTENEAVKEEYAEGSEVKRQEIDAEIDTEVESANTQVDDEFTSAENEAEAEELKAQKEVQAEKEKAEENQKEKSWWEKALDAVADFFESLKNLVNKIFDGLRAFVKKVIDKAKEFASAIIDKVRDMVVGMIKAFGEALKALVNIALAAFPELAAKFNAMIDKAVNAAVAAVNAIAEGLKAAVNALLDIIGAAIDAYLAIYQAIINAVLDVMSAIVEAIRALIIGLANLVESAGEMPPAFPGQISEELMGTDVTEPLENELPMPEATPAATTEVPAELSAMDEAEEEMDPSTASLMNKGSYSEGDFDVDPAPSQEELSPELNAELAQKPEGEYEFGEEYGTPNGMEEMKGEIAPEESPMANETIENEPAATEEEPAQALPEMAPNGKPWVGPFTTSERMGHVASEMWTGIKTWLAENWVLLVAGLITGIVVLIAANILTGGAIMASLPLLMQILSVYFAADAMFNLAKYFGNFLTKGWVGETVAAGKDLARGLGILLIELIFTLMFGAKGAFKAVKGGMKAAKGGMKGIQKAGMKAVKGQIKQTKNLVKSTGKGLRESGQKMVRNGKFVVGGLKKGGMKAAKSLDNLGKQLGKKLKFKKFKIVIKGKRFKLYGQMNPWVLLSDGKLEKRDIPGGKVGDTVKGVDGGLDGVIVGTVGSTKGSRATSSRLVGNLDEAQHTTEGLAKNKAYYDDLTDTTKYADDASRANKIKGGSGIARNPAFRKNFFKMLEDFGLVVSPTAKKFLAIHHVVPNFLKGNARVAKLLEGVGHNIDEVMNAIALPRIDLPDLDNVVRQFDEAVAAGRNADEFLSQIDEFKAILNLGDDVDMTELKKVMQELDDIKGASIHAVDTYHPKFNKMLEGDMMGFVAELDELMEAGMKEADAIAFLKQNVNSYIDNIFNDLLSGNPRSLL